MSSHTRRNFIKRIVRVTAMLGFATGCRRLQVTDTDEFNRGTIDKLRAKLKGRLILPTDSSYESARKVFYWNAGTERRPAVIVRCAHEEDALRAVEFARSHRLELAVRSGGHSHLGWGCSNGLVIDLSGMKQISIDQMRRTVRAQAGALSGEVARAAGQYGLAPVLGQCPESAPAASFLAAAWAGSPECTAHRVTICFRLALWRRMDAFLARIQKDTPTFSGHCGVPAGILE